MVESQLQSRLRTSIRYIVLAQHSCWCSLCNDSASAHECICCNLMYDTIQFSRTPLLVNDFTCKEDLVDCLIGSCWIPFYMHQAATTLLKHRGNIQCRKLDHMNLKLADYVCSCWCAIMKHNYCRAVQYNILYF